MGLFGRLKEALSPPKLVTTRVNVREKPLYEQFSRIGAGLTPADVSRILYSADSGQPARLIDLFNESRQKDGHLQGICYTREIAVSLCEVDFIGREDQKLRDRKAIELCSRIRDEFENWPLLVEHLTSSFLTGHATAVIEWHKTRDGYLLPFRCKPVHARDFIFSHDSGALRYQQSPGDVTGVDLLAQNPGRIVQIQRRINGDVQVREGLIRVLVWAALFRNWSLKDWIALGEFGWKPWRLASYKKGASQKDIDELVTALELLGQSGVAVIPETTGIQVEWPKGMSPGTGGSSTHRELLDTMGREMSKAVLGQTTSSEPGPNGSRASDQIRDKIRTDIREQDAISVSAVLRAHLFAPACAVNLSEGAVVPVPWFATDESVDQLQFASAIEKLSGAGVRLASSWVRDEIGAPEPREDEEVIGVLPDPEPANGDPKDSQEDDAAA